MRRKMTDIAELSIQIEASAEKASKEIDKLIRRLDKLHTKLAGIDVSSLTGQLQALANVDLSNLDKLTGVKVPGISGGSGGRGGGGGSTIHLSSGIKHLGSALNSSRRAIVNTSKGIAGLAKNMTTARFSVGQLANTFMNLYFKLFMIRRLFSGLGKAFTSSMDMIETYHYFDVAIGKIGEGAKKDFAQHGYDSAEAYADSFRKRSLELTEKMSGYTFDSEGNYRSNGMKNLGVDADMVMQYQAQYGQIADSIGMSGEAALATSKALTMLATDWSSLRNIDFETAFEKMASGLAGQSRAVRALGIDITQASLQQTAYNLGITTSISKMDQAAKAELRMITILDQSRVAWGDLANTLNTPANQLRLIRQNTISLARAIGNVFLPIVQKVLPYVNALIIAIRKLFEWVGGLLGVKVSDASSGMGGIGETFTDFGDDGADSLGNLGNASDDANKKLKELKKTVLAFDELNILNGNDDDSSSKSKSGTGSGGTGLGAGEQGILDASLLDMLDEYEKVWNEAFEKMEDKANAIADKITGVFGKIHDFIKAKDWAGLGKYIASGINQGLDWIYDKMVSISPRLTSFVDKVARTLNGLVDNVNWSRIGEIVGVGLNSITGAISRWYKTFDFYNLGQKLADAFNSLQDKINWRTLGEAIGGKLKAAIDLGLGFVNKVRFGSIGTNIATALNSVMNMLNLDHASDLFTKTFRGIFEIIDNFNEHFKWTDLKFKITSFLNRTFQNLDLDYAGKVLNNALDKILDFAKYVSENVDFEKLGIEISKGLRRIQWRKHFETAFTVIKTILGSVMKGVLEEVFGDFGAGFADGFINGISDTVQLATDVISKLAEALNTLFQAIEKFVPGTGEALGKTLGVIVGLRMLLGTGGKIGGLIKGIFGGGAVLGGGTSGGSSGGGLFKTILGGSGGEFLKHPGAAGYFAIKDAVDLFTQASNTGSEGSFIDVINKSMENLGSTTKLTNGQINTLIETVKEATSSGKEPSEITKEVAGNLHNMGIYSEDLWSSIHDSGIPLSGDLAIAFAGIHSEMNNLELSNGRLFQWYRQNAKTAIKDLQDNASEMGVKLNYIAEKQNLIHQINEGYDWSVFGTGKEAIEKMAEAVEEAWNQGAIGAEVYDALNGVLQDEYNKDVPNAQDAWVGLSNRLREMYGDNAAPLSTLVDYFASKIPTSTSTGMAQVSGSVSGAVGSVKKSFSDMQANVSTIIGNMQSSTVTKVAGMSGTIATSFAGIKSDAESKTDSTTKHVTTKWDETKRLVSAAIEGAKAGIAAGITKFNNNIAGYFNPAVESAKTLETELGVNLANTAKNVGTNLPSFFAGVSGAIAGHFSGTYDNIYRAMNVSGMYGLGASITNGLQSGISSRRLSLPHVGWNWQRLTYGPADNRQWFEVPQLYVNWYAKGGIPNAGELFWMNENNNPELMYKKGGRTHIDSNTEIVNSLKEAFTDSLMDVAMSMSSQSNNGQAPVIEYTFKVDSETMFKTVQKGAKKMSGRGYKFETAF